MFSKKPDPIAQTHRPVSIVKVGIPSIITSDLRIRGDLVCSGDIQIDGWIDGDILSRSITVGQGATVQGNLQAEEVRIAGSLNGEVRADLVVLEKTAHVNGDVVHKSLAIEEGAFLEGMCRRLDGYVASVVGIAMLAEPSGGIKKTIGNADIETTGSD